MAYKIISENNKVNYGMIDEPIDYNKDLFVLKSIFNKTTSPFLQKYHYHQFNYLGIVNDEYAIGIATIDLTFAYSIFSFVYKFNEGIVFKTEITKIIKGKNFVFEHNPENYLLEYKDKKNSLLILHSKEKGELDIHLNFNSKFILNGTLDFSLENNPLRVLNPTIPTRWSFTEKKAPLHFNSLDCAINGKAIQLEKGKTSLCYDWTGGFLRRETCWYWAMLSGITTKKKLLGANLASLVNESFYPENAVWIDDERTTFNRIIFDFNQNNPMEPWHIFSPNNDIDLIFAPQGSYSRKFSSPVILKTNFNQYIGHYFGTIKVNKEKHLIKDVPGFSEVQVSLW